MTTPQPKPRTRGPSRPVIPEAQLVQAARIAAETRTAIEIEATPTGTLYRIAPAGLPMQNDQGLAEWRERKARRGNAGPL